jgi:hypothetical protein
LESRTNDNVMRHRREDGLWQFHFHKQMKEQVLQQKLRAGADPGGVRKIRTVPIAQVIAQVYGAVFDVECGGPSEKRLARKPDFRACVVEKGKWAWKRRFEHCQQIAATRLRELLPIENP